MIRHKHTQKEKRFVKAEQSILLNCDTMNSGRILRKTGWVAVLAICLLALPGAASAEDIFSYQTENRSYSLEKYTDIFAIEESRDGGYIIGGLASKDDGSNSAFVLKTDRDGEQLWSKIYPGEMMISIKELDDGRIVAASFKEFIKAGSSYAPISGSGHLFITEQDGTVIWTEELPGDMPGAVLIDEEEIILVGWRWNLAEEQDILEGFFYRYDLLGARVGEVTYEGVSIHDILTTDDGGYLILGSSEVRQGAEAVYYGHLTKINASGTPKWTETYDNRALFAITEMDA